MTHLKQASAKKKFPKSVSTALEIFGFDVVYTKVYAFNIKSKISEHEN